MFHSEIEPKMKSTILWILLLYWMHHSYATRQLYYFQLPSNSWKKLIPQNRLSNKIFRKWRGFLSPRIGSHVIFLLLYCNKCNLLIVSIKSWITLTGNLIYFADAQVYLRYTRCAIYLIYGPGLQVVTTKTTNIYCCAVNIQIRGVLVLLGCFKDS